MRVLISCKTCQRRYDASGKKLGAKFRCHCGEVLRVRQPKSHAASVVRCSSCGGARQEGARQCGYCGADFTLHERDLHTVCPGCFARVSDTARYCPQCGDMLSAESVASDLTSRICPVCPAEAQLASRRLGKEKLNVLECQRCTGLWIGVEAFKELRKRAAQQAVSLDGATFGQPKPNRLKRHTGPMYRQCVDCRRLMTRRQYATGSGVIIDVCKDHGIWFDADELHQVLTWISEGGNAETPIRTKHKRERRSRTSGTTLSSTGRYTGSHSGNDFLDSLLSGLFGGWGRLL